MTEEFTKLFIFDGELANDLFNSQKTKAEGAIRSVFYLDRLQSLDKRVDDALKSKLATSKKTKVKEASMLKTLERELSSLKRDREAIRYRPIGEPSPCKFSAPRPRRPNVGLDATKRCLLQKLGLP